MFIFLTTAGQTANERMSAPSPAGLFRRNRREGGPHTAPAPSPPDSRTLGSKRNKTAKAAALAAGHAFRSAHDCPKIEQNFTHIALLRRRRQDKLEAAGLRDAGAQEAFYESSD